MIYCRAATCFDFALGGPGDYMHTTPPHPAETFEAAGLVADQLR